jgi:hypothetical protein
VAYAATLTRIDATHSNVLAHAPVDVIWPDEDLWVRLRAANVLATEDLSVDGPADHDVAGDALAHRGAHFDFNLPMPGVARIRLRPAQSTPSEQPD